MTSNVSECALNPVGDNDVSLAPTCSVSLTTPAVPSVQYQCSSDGQAQIASVVVHATDPKSKITAPFKLAPNEGCGNICHFRLRGTGKKVSDLKVNTDAITIGNHRFTPDSLCDGGIPQ